MRGRCRSQRQLRLGGGERLQRLLPVALEATRDQAVLGLDLPAAPLSALGVVAGTLDLQPPLGS